MNRTLPIPSPRDRNKGWIRLGIRATSRGLSLPATNRPRDFDLDLWSPKPDGFDDTLMHGWDLACRQAMDEAGIAFGDPLRCGTSCSRGFDGSPTEASLLLNYMSYRMKSFAPMPERDAQTLIPVLARAFRSLAGDGAILYAELGQALIPAPALAAADEKRALDLAFAPAASDRHSESSARL